MKLASFLNHHINIDLSDLIGCMYMNAKCILLKRYIYKSLDAEIRFFTHHIVASQIYKISSGGCGILIGSKSKKYGCFNAFLADNRRAGE